jgi:hypothetical protein
LKEANIMLKKKSKKVNLVSSGVEGRRQSPVKKMFQSCDSASSKID